MKSFVSLFFITVLGLCSSVLYAQSDQRDAAEKPAIIDIKASDSQTGHPPVDALDANIDSRWAVNGTDQWLELTFSDDCKIDAVAIGFARGERKYEFEVQVPRGGEEWSTIGKFHSSGHGHQIEKFSFPSVSCRRFRIVSHGSSANAWMNIHTVAFPGLEVNLGNIRRTESDVAGLSAQGNAETPLMNQPAPLEFSRWSGRLNIPDPVAISFDWQGRAYVTQTQRRKSQDLDIRAHTAWIPDDVGFASVQDKRDFYHRVLAVPGAEASARGNIIKDMNNDGSSDYRDLMVISEKIHVVEDTDGDGTGDRMRLYAEGFQTEVTGIAAGVLWHDNAVYSTIAPDVWKLRDTTGDGVADQRDVIATGFGLHIAYAGHDMHGLTVGPDGKIYWTVGDKGISVTSADGRKFHYPNQGGVMRCNPDGSDFEVFAHGLRNVQELAFDEFGNLFGVDNDADQPGERERVVYIVKGMDAGWRCNYQYRGKGYNPWTAERLWNKWFAGQATYIIPPLAYSLNGPAGFAYNPGTALSEDYRGYFFLTGAPGGEQRAFRMAAAGATFQVDGEHEIGRGIPLVGINFGPDGALYGVDWGGGYPLNQKGAIWQIDAADGVNQQLRQETKAILAAGFEDLAGSKLRDCLEHPDQRVRLGAQFELVSRGESALLYRVAADRAAVPVGRRHAIWGIGQLLRQEGSSADDAVLSALLADPNADIRIQVLRIIADLREYDETFLIALLTDGDPRVRFHAAIALQRHGTKNSLVPLIELAAQVPPEQTYLRHAVSFGLSGQDSPQRLSQLSQHESEMVRLMAVVALRHKYDAYQVGRSGAYLSPFLNDSSMTVSSEAARAIYEMISRYGSKKDSLIRNELEALAAAIVDSSNVDESFLRRGVGAAYLLGGSEQVLRLASLSNREDVAVELRIDAINAIGIWEDPPKLDRVDGRRRYGESRRVVPSSEVGSAIARLFHDGDDRIRAAALKVSENLRIRFSDAELRALATVVSQSGAASELRIQALETLRSQGFEDIQSVVSGTLQSDDDGLRMKALELLADRPEQSVLAVREILSGSRGLAEKQHAIKSVAKLEAESGDVLLEKLFGNLLAGNAIPGTELEIIEAVRRRADHRPQLAQALESFDRERQARAAENPLAEWSECLVGGNPEAGRNTFLTHLTAACVRCHRVGNKGSTVGPNLEGISLKRDRNHLLRAIVRPSADIDAKYKTLTVLLLSGKVIQGLPLRRTDQELILADSQGKEVKIANDDIEESLEQKTSIMPDVTKLLTRGEIRDLVAWLSTLRKEASE